MSPKTQTTSIFAHPVFECFFLVPVELFPVESVSHFVRLFTFVCLSFCYLLLPFNYVQFVNQSQSLEVKRLPSFFPSVLSLFLGVAY